MRKFISAVMLLLLCLPSCANTGKTTDLNGVADNDVAEEKQNTVSEISDTPKVSDNNSEQYSDTFYIQGELPNIGEFSGKKKRYFEEYTSYFIPSESYGKIIPYVGQYKFFSTNDSEYPVKMGYPNYGFCDIEGRIIMDASDINRNIRYTKTNDGFGFYTLSISDDPKKETEDDIYLPQKTVLIPESGEWCINLDNGSMINDARNGIISVIVFEDPEIPGESVLYDYDGNELARIGVYDNVVLSDCGLIGVNRWAGDNDFNGFLNADGEKVLGPYKSITSFNYKGVAAVEDEDGWHLIDTSGKKLTDKAYDNISENKKDYRIDEPSIFTARRKDNKKITDIYTSEGKYLTTIEGSTYFSIRFPSDGDIIYYYTDYNTDKMVWKRISDGSDFICKEYGKVSNKYSGNDDYYVYEDEENKIGCVFDSNGDTILKIQDFFELHNVSPDGKYMIYSCGGYKRYYDNEKKQEISELDIVTYVHNTENGEDVYSFDGEVYAQFVGENNEYIMFASMEDPDNLFGTYDSYSLYDTKNERMVFEDCRNINYIDSGYFTVCTENSCSLYDKELNLILKQYNE